MSETVTKSFVLTKELVDCLEQWAKADDRSVSYILRDILKKECDRRAAQAQATKQQVEAN